MFAVKSYNTDEHHTEYLNGDPDGDRDHMQYLKAGLYPIKIPDSFLATPQWKGKLTGTILSQLPHHHKTKSLRILAKEYGVSHEAVRRALHRAE